jgi:hypothetical protein
MACAGTCRRPRQTVVECTKSLEIVGGLVPHDLLFLITTIEPLSEVEDGRGYVTVYCGDFGHA